MSNYQRDYDLGFAGHGPSGDTNMAAYYEGQAARRRGGGGLPIGGIPLLLIAPVAWVLTYTLLAGLIGAVISALIFWMIAKKSENPLSFTRSLLACLSWCALGFLAFMVLVLLGTAVQFSVGGNLLPWFDTIRTADGEKQFDIAYPGMIGYYLPFLLTWLVATFGLDRRLTATPKISRLMRWAGIMIITAGSFFIGRMVVAIL
jgi:hypothetical protein